MRRAARLGVVVACVASLTGASTASSRTRGCHRWRSDAYAREVARTAETTAETVATEYEGTYSHVSPATLHHEESSLTISRRAAVRHHEPAYLSAAGPIEGGHGYYVTAALVGSSDSFTIRRMASGSIEQTAVVCGRRRGW